MKTMKNVLLTGLLMITAVLSANDIKVVTNEGGNVTITQNQKMVSISVLNTVETAYQLFIYDTKGNLMYRGDLGAEASLGRIFDFEDAKHGNYTFTLVSENDERQSYSIKTGTRF